MTKEFQEQIAIFNFVKTYTDLPFVYIPNDGKRNAITGYKMTCMGLCPGASDILIPRAKEPYHGLFIELKVGKNRATKLQIEFMRNMEKEGYRCEVCIGGARAIEFIIGFYELKGFKL